MICNPVFGGGYGQVPGGSSLQPGGGTIPPGRRYYPKPNTSQFTWIEQYIASAMSNVAQGLELVSTVTGAGGTGCAAIQSILPLPSVSRISAQIFTTDITDTPAGANQAYQSGPAYYDTSTTNILSVGMSGRAGASPGVFSLERSFFFNVPGLTGGPTLQLVSGISLPLIISITFDGTTFNYYYGNSPGSLTLAGTETLTTIRGLDPRGASFQPRTAAILQINQDGEPGNPGVGTNTTIFSGFQVAA